MTKSIAIIQSAYIPWKGYFDIINMVDEFILYDDVQFSKNGWRNRNRIKTVQGMSWLTVPVLQKGRFGQRVDEVEVADRRWAAKHVKSLQANYASAPHSATLIPCLQEIYARAEVETALSGVNELFIREICELLGIRTRVSRSRDYCVGDDRHERLLELCSHVGATEYLSGPAAKAYLDPELFERHGVRLRWMDYSGYPEYRQLSSPPFVHEVSILDLILNVGSSRAWDFMLSDPPCPE